jgi:prepilin-type N-terminal cleavage/methylation domain-containing protein
MRRGSTLLELMVTLAIMAIVAGVATMALRSPGSTARSWYSEVSDARALALRSGAAVTIDVVIDDSVLVVTALPDGQVLAPAILALDRLSGERRDGGLYGAP